VNFFAYQDEARSNTRKLVVLFLCAVLTLIAITSFLVVGVLFYSESQTEMGITGDFLSSRIFIQVSLVVIAVIAAGTLYRLAQLRGGGKAVAEAMGGQLLNSSTRDSDEKKILNVVEEMAIASGTPVPPVYLMEDDGINAFAAGYKARDAVIGVTRGCIRQLSRDELQGVIAHEFSHIFNGDMRLNIRLIGLLYGIMVIGLIGYQILRSSRYRTASSSRSGKGNGGGILFLGLGLMVVGYGGTFFGNLIKSAVSRQREYLADASAVQFTRNPDGISGALKKIGGSHSGSEIHSTDVSEISHMLFSSGLKSSFSGLFATHPPLPDRISRIDPHWNGDYITPTQSTNNPVKENIADVGSSREGEPATGSVTGGAMGSALDAVGNPVAAHIIQAAVLLEGIPSTVREEVHHPMSASLLMYALLISLSHEKTGSEQMQILEATLEEKDFLALRKIRTDIAGIPRDQTLTLIDLAMPSLKQLSKIQYGEFMTALGKLIMADGEISLFEWCLFKILRYTLDGRPDKRFKNIGMEKLGAECETLMSVLAMYGHEREEEARKAFAAGVAKLEPEKALNFRPELVNDTAHLKKALDKLNHLKPLQKPRLLKAMVACINADGVVTPEEGELLRAVGNLLDCPIPPLLPGQRFI